MKIYDFLVFFFFFPLTPNIIHSTTCPIEGISSKTMKGDFPPNSKEQRFISGAHKMLIFDPVITKGLSFWKKLKKKKSV